MIDLDNYPDGTDEVLVALLEYEREDHVGGNKQKRRLIAARTSLNKGQVRYRLNKLIEDDAVISDTFTEGNQRITYYGLRQPGRDAAIAIEEAEDVLGRVPEQIDKDDILALTLEMAALREMVNTGETDAGPSEIQQQVDDLRYTQVKIEEAIDLIRNGQY